MKDFIGRKEELAFLDKKYHSGQSEVVVVTGRRRIGKSSLVREFCKGKPAYFFEGLEGEDTSGQLIHFREQLKQQIEDVLLQNVQFDSWEPAFTYLTTKFSLTKKKTIIFFDEFQWMAAERNVLVSLIKYYWDNHWKQKNVMLILCGSIASFMIQHVIKSKALYGRLTGELHLKSMSPSEVATMLGKKRSPEEILLYLMVFGGVPKYLELVHLSRSFYQNMNELCFTPEGLMVSEFNKVFYSHFKRHQIYLKIIHQLKDKLHSLQELSVKLKMPSGGGLQRYLTGLEDAEMISSYVSLEKDLSTKFKKYRLADEYLCFYFHFIKPHLRTIKESSAKKIFEMISKDNWNIWLGFSFERFCLKYASLLAKIMGFADQVLVASPYFGRADQKFQIDLLYKRADKVITLCEIKYHQQEIKPKIIKEVERKCSLFPLPKGYTLEKALITVYEPSQELREMDYFHHIVTLQDILK